MIAALLATGCELSTVVGRRELDDEFGDAGEEPPDDLPRLDFASGDCEPPPPLSCDSSSEEPLEVVGLDCLDGIPATGGLTGPSEAAAIQVGPLGPYAPREGEKFLVLSTGIAGHLGLTHAQLAALGCDDPLYCPDTNFELGPEPAPPPISFEPVAEDRSCVEDPSLVGSGDCSNSLYEEWSACPGGCELWDPSVLRVKLTVPARTYGLAFDFAFLSVEWPEFLDSAYNDMFVAWLESERWTGNVSFDHSGNPITVNSGFTDYTDAGPELDGFAMQGHAGTRWLTTGFGLAPGETIQLVLAVFDLSDGDHDSVVLLDGFRWTCTGTPPTTQPVP